MLFYRASPGLFQANHPASFAPLDYPLEHQLHHSRQQENSENSIEMVDYMLSNPPPQTQISFDKLSFADVMQFADFGPKLALNQSKISEDENYFLKFQVLGDKLPEDPLTAPPPPPPPAADGGEDRFGGTSLESKGMTMEEERPEEREEEGRFSENVSSVQQLRSVSRVEKAGALETKNRRKRPRSMKTSEEVESQRMTHIAVERNRRRQMNEHLRVLRSLMPGSYVQRVRKHHPPNLLYINNNFSLCFLLNILSLWIIIKTIKIHLIQHPKLYCFISWSFRVRYFCMLTLTKFQEHI